MGYSAHRRNPVISLDSPPRTIPPTEAGRPRMGRRVDRSVQIIGRKVALHRVNRSSSALYDRIARQTCSSECQLDQLVTLYSRDVVIPFALSVDN